MKKVLSFALAVLMVVGMIAIPTGAATATSGGGWNGSTATMPQGTGTKDDPYVISSAENLKWMSDMLNGKQYLATIGYNGQLWHPTYTNGWTEIEAYGNGTYTFNVNGTDVNIDGVPKRIVLSDLENAPQAYFVQTCDIDLNGKSLKTIGAYWSYGGNGTGSVKGQWFGGVYDGQGYSIKNGSIVPCGTSSANWNASGLFGNLWGATVKDLTFDNVHASGHISMGMVGGNVVSPESFKNELNAAACFDSKPTLIQNVQVKDSCTVAHTPHSNMATAVAYVGGLVGYATCNTSIIRCRNDADISFGMYAAGVGGMVGRMTKNCRVEFCVNTGDLIPAGGTLKQQSAYGGIVGTWEPNGVVEYHGKNAVVNCVNAGTLKKSEQAITGSGSTVISYGGIVGRTLTLVSAKNSAGDATEWKFENNINIGASPTLHSGNSGYANPRAAAGVGSLWNGDSQYDPQNGLYGDHVVLVAKNCYTVDTFDGIAGYALRPSADCPILCSQIKSGSVYCGRAESCYTKTRAEIEALPLYQNIMAAVGECSDPHKILGVQTKSESNGTYSVRFLGAIDTVDYKSYSFTLTTIEGNNEKTETFIGWDAYTSIVADGKTVSSSDYGYSYFTSLTVKDLKANTEYTLSITPTVASRYAENDTAVSGSSTTIVIKNGKVSIPVTDMKTYSVKDSAVRSQLKLLGRSVDTNTGITMDWSAATVEFNAECAGEIKLGFNTSRSVRFIVYVDGALVNSFTTSTGVGAYTIVRGLRMGNHNIRVVRTTKVEYSNVGALAELQSISLGGTLGAKPANKKYLIEFVGDSVTAGVGAGSNTDPEAYAEHTYAYQTAQALDADYSVVAIPGIGTLSSTGRHNGLTIYDAYKYNSYYRSSTTVYTPDRQADLVVFATNANDSNSADVTAFKARVRDMIEQAQEFHGEDVKFVWVFNMYADKNTINGYVREVFAEYGGESAGFYTLDFYRDNSGGDVHPSGAAHDAYTQRLVTLIEQKNILN